MGQGDKVLQIKAIFNFRKKLKKQKHYMRILFMIIVFLIFSVFLTFQYAKNVENESIQHIVNSNKSEEEKEKMQEQNEHILSQNEQILSQYEEIQEYNQQLIEENLNLQNSLKIAAMVGIKPQNYKEPEEVTEPVDFSKMTYLGQFEGTAYTPSKEECGNDLGYTASGKAIIPGGTIAVDTKYWKLGTKFYIKGLGYVVAMDTGSAVKGEKRFDFAVLDKEFALKIGRRMWDVYLVEEP